MLFLRHRQLSILRLPKQALGVYHRSELVAIPELVLPAVSFSLSAVPLRQCPPELLPLQHQQLDLLCELCPLEVKFCLQIILLFNQLVDLLQKQLFLPLEFVLLQPFLCQ